jgi:hypothetical protein
MTRTVDLVIVGMTANGGGAAIDAARRGRRVLVVDESRNRCCCRALRQALKTAGDDCLHRVSILTGVELVWVDGTTAVEVVLFRQIKTGRLIGINTAAVLMTTAFPIGFIAPMLRAQVLRNSADQTTQRSFQRRRA